MTGFLSLESSRLGAAGQETEIMGLRLEPEASANSQFVDLAKICFGPDLALPIDGIVRNFACFCSTGIRNFF